MSLVLPHTISPGSPRDAGPVQENFEAVRDWANGGIGSDNIASGAIDTANLVDSAVDTAKIADNAVTTNKLSTSILATYKSVSDEHETRANATADTFYTIADLSGVAFSNTGQNCLVLFSGHVTVAIPGSTDMQCWVAVQDSVSGVYVAQGGGKIFSGSYQNTIPLTGYAACTAGTSYEWDVKIKFASSLTGTITYYGEGGRSKIAAFALPYEA